VELAGASCSSAGSVAIGAFFQGVTAMKTITEQLDELHSEWKNRFMGQNYSWKRNRFNSKENIQAVVWKGFGGIIKE
jgi:hypothetical protein